MVVHRGTPRRSANLRAAGYGPDVPLRVSLAGRCPLPPAGNVLPFAVRAGEKAVLDRPAH